MNKNKQVIRISPDGTASTIANSLIDLRLLGSVKIDRVSDIKFDESTQMWRIQFDCRRIDPTGDYGLQDKVSGLSFDTYQEAVDKEVEVLNEYLRKSN